MGGILYLLPQYTDFIVSENSWNYNVRRTATMIGLHQGGTHDILCIEKKQKGDLEFKVSKSMGDLQRDAEKAAAQIQEKGYVSNLLEERYEKIMTYGFAFFEKRCVVVRGKTYEKSPG